MGTRLDPLEYLERSDKWYLGGGMALCFAPPFPYHLDALGFWDEAHYADVPLSRLFTVLLLDETERPVDLRRDGRRWTPDALTQTYAAPDGIRVREDKVVTPHDTLASRISVHNDGKRARRLHAVLWSLRDAVHEQDEGAWAADVTCDDGAIAFAHAVRYGRRPYADRPAWAATWGEPPASRGAREEPHHLYVALGTDRPPDSLSISLAEPTDTAPRWQTSPVPEKLRNGALDGRVDAALPDASVAGPSHLHLCLHRVVEVPVGESRTVQFGASVSLDRASASQALRLDLGHDVCALSRDSWREYFASVPYFECSDPHIQRTYWYRWYGLRMLTVRAPDNGNSERFRKPCVFEGIDGFRSHISYSAQCHILETSWMHDLTLAMGCIEGMLEAQEKSGFIPGHLYLWREPRGFYHANWGECALRIYQVTGDRSFVERVYPGLSRYADYFERDRDREDWHLYDIADQGETGQEYMSRYLFADPCADDWRKIRLKGVDATVYVYLLQRALAEMAALLGKQEEEVVWNRKADATREAVRSRMWDPERGFFFDVDPRTGSRSPVAAALGFYPYLCDIADENHLVALRDHLLNPERFWTPYPVPASPVDDPCFSAEGEWKGRRMSCPWNGRVWPMTNSHVAAALARAARCLDPALRPWAAELICRFVRLLFHDGDATRPNAYEHYNPFTGTASVYRGIDDYQHSFVNDLLIRNLIGLQPRSDDRLVLDPLPFGVASFQVEDLRYRGHSLTVRSDASGFEVEVDGAAVWRSSAPERVDVPLPIRTPG